MSSPVCWEAETNNGLRPTPGYEADGVDLLLALTPAGFLAGLSGIRVAGGIVQLWQTLSRKAPIFAWATFKWVNCIINTFVTFE